MREVLEQELLPLEVTGLVLIPLFVGEIEGVEVIWFSLLELICFRSIFMPMGFRSWNQVWSDYSTE